MKTIIIGGVAGGAILTKIFIYFQIASKQKNF